MLQIMYKNVWIWVSLYCIECEKSKPMKDAWQNKIWQRQDPEKAKSNTYSDLPVSKALFQTRLIMATSHVYVLYVWVRGSVTCDGGEEDAHQQREGRGDVCEHVGLLDGGGGGNVRGAERGFLHHGAFTEVRAPQVVYQGDWEYDVTEISGSFCIAYKIRMLFL